MQSDPKQVKKVVNRLSRLEGQIRAVRRTIEEEEKCEDIVIQLSAVHSALEGATKLIVTNFFRTCLAESQENKGNQEEAIERFLSLLLNTKM